MVALPEQIKVNSWRYTLIRAGRISATAKYVHTAGHMATASEFRKQLAAVNTFTDSPEIPGLRDTPSLGWDVVNGIIIHGPVSRDFRSEGFRHIGFLNFGVPWQGFDGWAANFPITEILQAYEAKTERRPAVDPKWKKLPKADDDQAS